ncbi:MAG: hypothetical protein AB2792_12630 [Candidatus Thiodiazotropha sp.]
MTLHIQLCEGELPIIRRMKNSLLKRYNPNRVSDIEKAIELANYLTSLKEYEQAQKFLDSFVYLDPKKELRTFGSLMPKG